jgi:hypothetical protein
MVKSVLLLTFTLDEGLLCLLAKRPRLERPDTCAHFSYKKSRCTGSDSSDLCMLMSENGQKKTYPEIPA